MSHANRTFRIFVSSTFADLKAERNALQEQVFPRLRRLCAQQGCRFQAIDLRWGVGQEAGLDQRTMEICLEEISRCQRITPRPNFIVLLGERYGWCPLPAAIAAPDFAVLLQEATPTEKALLLWSDGQPAAAQGWYRRDDNALLADAERSWSNVQRAIACDPVVDVWGIVILAICSHSDQPLIKTYGSIGNDYARHKGRWAIDLDAIARISR